MQVATITPDEVEILRYDPNEKPKSVGLGFVSGVRIVNCALIVIEASRTATVWSSPRKHGTSQTRSWRSISISQGTPRFFLTGSSQYALESIRLGSLRPSRRTGVLLQGLSGSWKRSFHDRHQSLRVRQTLRDRVRGGLHGRAHHVRDGRRHHPCRL